MIWLLIVIAIIAIIVIVVVNNRKKQDEEFNQVRQVCIKEINNKWAICVTRFSHSEHLEPCLIRIIEHNGEKELVRISKGNTQEERLFKISEEHASGCAHYQWGGDDDSGSYSLCTIDALLQAKKTEHVIAQCGLTLTYQRNILSYRVLAFVEDAKDAIEIINNN